MFAQSSTSPTAESSNRAAWFTHDRFGMMIHFGLYSIPAGIWKGEPMGRNWYAEWIQVQGNWPQGIPAFEYRALAESFNPVDFDAREWISELAGAGMGYIVVTSKHHDGFALWPSKVSDYNVVDATPFKRDIIGEIKAACDEFDIKFGLYYSHWLDWDHPYGGRPHEDECHSEPRWAQPSQDQFEVYWQEKSLAQVRELIEAYDPKLFWFDTWSSNSTPFINERRMDELIGMIRTMSPNCLINSRIGTWGHSKGTSVIDYLSMGDNQFPDETLAQPWETAVTMRHSYGDNQLDFNWKSTRAMLAQLTASASRGGNYTLNCGPKASGTLSRPEVRRLREFGAWFSANGEAIYGACPNPLPAQSWGEITSRKLDAGATLLYLHLTRPPSTDTLTVAGLATAPSVAYVLETGQPLITRVTGDTIEVDIPAEVDRDIIPVFVLRLPG
ncbi:MAG TPA: alpha-L-fucosidase [Capsulimonadaceae bacterium]|jgi:alpha-L-fucosidase